MNLDNWISLWKNLFAAIAIAVAFAFALGFVSKIREPSYLPTLGGQLRPCPQSPNCVSSTGSGTPAHVEPLVRAKPGTPRRPWQDALTVIAATGGSIKSQRDGYVWAEFSSPILGFIDDLEILSDPDGNWQVRSASRIGYSDLGANRRRVETLGQRLEQIPVQ